MKYIPFLLCLLLLQACSATQRQSHSYNSYIGEQASLDTIEGITADLSTYLSELYPAGHTKVKIITPTQTEGEGITEEFSVSFENALRKKGFEIADVAQLLISYTLDSLDDESSWYVLLRLSDGVSIARIYDAFGYSNLPRIHTNSPRK